VLRGCSAHRVGASRDRDRSLTKLRLSFAESFTSTARRGLSYFRRTGIIIKKGEWVRYSTPSPEGAEYIAVCLPAFSPAIVHRDVE
jgi:hypothetical protein